MVTTAQTIPTRAFFRKCCSVPFSCSGYFCLTVSIFPAVIPEHLSHPEPSVVSHFPLSHFPLTGSPCIQLKWQFNEKFHLDGMCCFSNLSAVSEATGRGLHSSSTAFISQHNHGPLAQTPFFAGPLTFFCSPAGPGVAQPQQSGVLDGGHLHARLRFAAQAQGGGVSQS